jgi:hypothetical protein
MDRIRSLGLQVVPRAVTVTADGDGKVAVASSTVASGGRQIPPSTTPVVAGRRAQDNFDGDRANDADTVTRGDGRPEPAQH